MFYSFFFCPFFFIIFETSCFSYGNKVQLVPPNDLSVQTANSFLKWTSNYKQLPNTSFWFRKAIKQSSVLLHSKVKKVSNKQLLFPLYPFLSHSTVCDTALRTKGSASPLRSLMYFSCAFIGTPDARVNSECDEWHQIWFGTLATLWNKALIVHVAEKLPDS